VNIAKKIKKVEIYCKITSLWGKSTTGNWQTNFNSTLLKTLRLILRN